MGSDARGFKGALVALVIGRILASVTNDAPLDGRTGEALTGLHAGDAVGLIAKSWRGIASVTERQGKRKVS